MLTIILALLPYVYRRLVSSYPKQISHFSLNAQMSLMVLLFITKHNKKQSGQLESRQTQGSATSGDLNITVEVQSERKITS